jgi:hypothetical protein
VRKMDIFIVKGKALDGKYSENVHHLEGMEEKPKSYVGLGRKISKAKIGVIEEGVYHGMFQIVLTDKSEIDNARKKSKKKSMNTIWKNTSGLKRPLNLLKVMI